MKIIFPEYSNKIIKQAIKESNIDAIAAESLEDACKKLAENKANTMIAGIDRPTRDVVLACRDFVPKTGKYFSSCFVMKKEDKRFILADAGICKSPDEEMLIAIVLQTYETAKKVLDEEPKIAMLSFSSFGSAKNDTTIDMIRSVINKIKAEYPEIIIDGEMQLDTAMNPEIGKKKAPDSEVAGQANILICPDLNSGNILYKGLEQLGGWTAAGPIIQGFEKPISDLSRGSSVEDVKFLIEIMEKLVN